MTEFEVVEYQEVNNRNFSMINDICDKETKGKSFLIKTNKLLNSMRMIFS